EPRSAGLSTRVEPPPRRPAGLIESSFADDPRMVEAIDRFVSRLPERVDALLHAASSGDRPTLQREAHQLKGAAGGYGFGTRTDAAAALEQELRLGADPLDPDLPALRELIDLCRRAASPRVHAPVERDYAPDRAGD